MRAAQSVNIAKVIMPGRLNELGFSLISKNKESERTLALA